MTSKVKDLLTHYTTKWKKIKEEGRFLRVILLPDGETVHNAFFDRRFKGGMK